MKVSFESKGNLSATSDWLSKMSKISPTQTLNQIASEGKKALSSNTPKDTGETAAGWVAEVKMEANNSEVAWKNTSHPETSANIATLIELGHGTKNGGYVQPRPYIKQAMDSVFRDAGDRIAEELIK